jgi:3-hydroxyisobutyrate dehydrogenase-like beta-hydroxyacid dehydrogenase
MKIAVIGTGLIGSQVVRKLTAAGHDATGTPARPASTSSAAPDSTKRYAAPRSSWT